MFCATCWSNVTKNHKKLQMITESVVKLEYKTIQGYGNLAKI